jgi:hypothetical protein
VSADDGRYVEEADHVFCCCLREGGKGVGEGSLVWVVAVARWPTDGATRRRRPSSSRLTPTQQDTAQ